MDLDLETWYIDKIKNQLLISEFTIDDAIGYF